MRAKACLVTLSVFVLTVAFGAASAAAVVAPVVTFPRNTPLGQGTMGIGAYVNPGGAELTDCHIAYGPTTSYGQSAPCISMPPVNEGADLVTAHISGLTSGATYHYKLVVSGPAGSAESEDGLFKTLEEPSQEPCLNAGALGSGQLPDCRAWEMVSPLDKNGGDIGGQLGRTHAAADGSALAFASLAGFAGTAGSTVATEYIAERSTEANPGNSGWTTHGITPLQGSMSFLAGAAALEPGYKGAFSPNLDRAVFSAYSPVTDNPSVEKTINLYVSRGLLTPGGASYQLLTGCPLCEESSEPLAALPSNLIGAMLQRPELAGASSDFGHIVFESLYALTKEAPAQPPLCNFQQPFSAFNCHERVWEWDHGTVRLAGILPGNIPADVSIAGARPYGVFIKAESFTPHVVSDGEDGHSRVFFTWPTADGVNSNPYGSAGNVYMRLDHSTTVQLNTSVRTGGPTSYVPAEYRDASSDGKRVFFTTSQALTNNAPDNSSTKLYMYETEKAVSDPSKLTLIDITPPGTGEHEVIGVIGVSENGHYVYFVAKYGPLEKGGPGGRSIYLWHDSRIVRVAGATNLKEAEYQTQGWMRPPHKQARVTSDGKHLLFSETSGEGLLSTNGGVDYDQSKCSFGCRELYVYSADTNTLQCASCNPSGGAAPELGDNEVVSVGEGGLRSGGTIGNLYENHALSNDGRYVFFNSTERLVPQATNGQMNVYEYNTLTGAPRLLSSGESPAGSYFLDASVEGTDAFILTQEPLSRWDTGQLYDVYDARARGGFPEPPALPASCQGDACQPPALQLNDATPASLSFAGPGDQNAAPTVVHRQKRSKQKHPRKKRAKGHLKRNVKRNRRVGR